MSEQILYIFFLASMLLPLHSFVIYPFHIWLKSKALKPKIKETSEFIPSVSIIICCYNEESVIEATLHNFLEIDYPASKIEILIGSDGSTDNTNSIIENIARQESRIKFFKFSERRGKSFVLNDITSQTEAEILIFSDANTCYKKDAVKVLVSNFTNDSIGGVSGRLKLLEYDKPVREGSKEKLYWDAESWLKEKEGILGILIGANGGIYAIRRDLFTKLPLDKPVPDDFFISMKILEKKWKLIYDSRAVATEYIGSGIIVEFNRKKRIAMRSISSLKVLKNLLSPKSGFVAYAFWSHKVLRWFMPIYLIILLVSSFLLGKFSNTFHFIFLIQIISYLLFAMNIMFMVNKIKIPLISFGSYFLITNAALFVGIINTLLNRKQFVWSPHTRKPRKWKKR